MESEEIRLNKYLSEMGICSRREADRLIEAGKVLVDGKPATMGVKIVKGKSQVTCNGKPVGAPGGEKIRHVVLAVNKPVGVVCTTTDNDRAPNIVDLVSYPTRIYPVGRLDKDSEGLILMTNQGELVNLLLRRENGHEKEYVVTVDQPFNQAFLNRMSEGVEIEDKATGKKRKTDSCKVWASGAREFHVVLTQGLNRQIRRMCGALGYKVISLKRIRIMNIRLGNLKPGDCRRITPEELETLQEELLDGRGNS